MGKIKFFTTVLLISLRIVALSQSTIWTEDKLKEYWKKNGADDIEGIYSREIRYFTHASGLPQGNNSQIDDQQYYILKTQDKYILTDFAGKFNAVLTPTYDGSKFLLTTDRKDSGDEVHIYGNVRLQTNLNFHS